MRHAILFAVAGNTKFEVRVRYFRRPANCTTMQRFYFGFAGLHFKTPTAFGNIATMTRIPDDARAEKDQVVRHRADGSGAKLHRTKHYLHEQDRSRDPSHPFHFYRQDVGEVDNEIGIKLSES